MTLSTDIWKNKCSLFVMLCLLIWMLFFRLTHLMPPEISWDVFGYYLPLEATFIHGDMWLNDRSWVEALNQEHQLTGTLYQISTTPDGQPMYFFFLGMAMMYTPFFFVGHAIAGMFGYAQDGLSSPYVYSLIVGCLIYGFIGLFYLRKILKHFFSDQLVAILLIICVIGTNYINHMTIKNLETVNVIFMFNAIIIWNTIQWYARNELKNMIVVGFSIVMMALIKPSEVLMISLPILWGVSSKQTLLDRFKLFWTYRKQIIITGLICCVVVAPQVTYWIVKTGKIFYDSYKNPGVGLDVFEPHFIQSLFGYRKGWLVYTPVMIFALLGFIILFKQNRPLFFGLFIPFFISFYIIVSWSEYWYGAGFSNRPVIVLYPILLIAMGYFLQWIWSKGKILKVGITLLISFCIFLNIFQWWQYRNYIIDGTRMTKEYYWKVFLKTTVDAETRDLLLVERSYYPGEVHVIHHPEKYKSKLYPLKEGVYSQKTADEFIGTMTIPFHELTKKDHCYVRFQFDYQVQDSTNLDAFFSVMMNRKNGDYNNMYFRLNTDQTSWQHFDTVYMTPEIRNVKDDLKFFLWNPNLQTIDIKNLQLEVFERKG